MIFGRDLNLIKYKKRFRYGIDPWVSPHDSTHAMFVRWPALPLWVSADFPKRSRRRGSVGGSRKPAADRGPKKACPRQRSVLLLPYCPRLSHWGLPVLLVLVLLLILTKARQLGLRASLQTWFGYSWVVLLSSCQTLSICPSTWRKPSGTLR